MRRVVNLYQTTVGKKVAMAVTGILLFVFVLVHLAGNLKVYQGPEKFDAYAEFLRDFGAPILDHGQFLWIARIGLLAAVLLHGIAAVQLARTNRRARPVGYRRRNDLTLSYASRTMRWGGVMLAAFVVYHLLHLTTGTVHPDFGPSPYANLVTGFRSWPATAAYVSAMVPLALHVYHGVWSATQTLAVQNRWVTRWRRPAAAAVAGLIFAGNVSIPLSVLAGWVG